MFVRGTGTVSRYKLFRSQKSVTVQDLNCRQMRASIAVALAKAGFAQGSPESSGRSWVPGCNNHYESVSGAGARVRFPL